MGQGVAHAGESPGNAKHPFASGWLLRRCGGWLAHIRGPGLNLSSYAQDRASALLPIQERLGVLR